MALIRSAVPRSVGDDRGHSLCEKLIINELEQGVVEMRWQWLFVLGMLSLCAGCQNQRLTRVSLVNGQVVVFAADEPPAGATSDVLTSACLESEPDTCFRLSGQSVLESVDGRNSWQIAWEIDGTEAWIHSIGAAPSDTAIKPTDMVVTPAGEVFVAVGAIDPIRRTTDGEWTPSSADLKRFPFGPWLGLVSAVLAVGAAIVWGSGRRPGSMMSALYGIVALCASAAMFATPNSVTVAIGLSFVIVGGLLALLLVAVRVSLGRSSEVFESGNPKSWLALGLAGLLSAAPLALWAAGVGRWSTAAYSAALCGLFALVAVWWFERGTRQRLIAAQQGPKPDTEAENTARLTSAWPPTDPPARLG